MGGPAGVGDMKVEAKNIGRVFKLRNKQEVTALQDFNLSVGNNEFVSIIGPSGCGKSSFLQMVAGLDYPDRGSIRVDGNLVDSPGADRGMVFQGYTLFPWLTVAENVKFGLKKTQLQAAEKEKLVGNYIELVGLTGFENVYPRQLSGGMRQRVAIARALVGKPKVLLMDEPFGALDAQTRLMMQALLLEVWERERTTVLFVTHDVEEAIVLSDRVYLMTARPGRVKAEVRIDLPRPRKFFEAEFNPKFQSLRKQLLELIREEVELAFQAGLAIPNF